MYGQILGTSGQDDLMNTPTLTRIEHSNNFWALKFNRRAFLDATDLALSISYLKPCSTHWTSHKICILSNDFKTKVLKTYCETYTQCFNQINVAK